MTTASETWLDDMAEREIERLIQQVGCQDFDHVFRITRDGPVDGPRNVCAPSVYLDGEKDIGIDGDSAWTPMTGYTAQYGYSGAVMHSSEHLGGTIARDVIEMAAEAEAEGEPLLWTMTVAETPPGDDEPDPEPAGWAILFRGA